MSDLKQAASPTGKGQKAIMEYLSSREGKVQLTDMSAHPSFRGMHYGNIESAAQALAKKGFITLETKKGEGTLVSKKASKQAAEQHKGILEAIEKVLKVVESGGATEKAIKELKSKMSSDKDVTVNDAQKALNVLRGQVSGLPFKSKIRPVLADLNKKLEASIKDAKKAKRHFFAEEKVAKLPDHETQLKMLQKNPPKIEENDGLYNTMVFSPSTNGYIAQGEHPTKEEADKDLRILKRDQGRAEMKLKRLIKDEKKKTAAEAAAAFAKEAKVFHNEHALQQYLKTHPKADPSKHSVKNKSKGKGDKGNPLKGLDKDKRKKVIERAIKQEEEAGAKSQKKFIDDGVKKDKREKSEKKVIDDALKGLSPKDRKKKLQDAIKKNEKKASQAAEEFRKALQSPSAKELARQAAEEFRLACEGACESCSGVCQCQR